MQDEKPAAHFSLLVSDKIGRNHVILKLFAKPFPITCHLRAMGLEVACSTLYLISLQTIDCGDGSRRKSAIPLLTPCVVTLTYDTQRYNDFNPVSDNRVWC